MSKINREPDLAGIIRRLEQRIRVLENSNRLTSASIKGGTLIVRDDDNSAVFEAGQVGYAGDPNSYPGVAAFRPNGTATFAAAQHPGGDSYASICDGQGNDLFTSDEAAGVGIRRPHGVWTMYPSKSTQWASTVSATFESLYNGIARRTHAKVYALGVATTPVGTTAEIQLWVNAAQVPGSGTITIPSGSTSLAWEIGPIAMAAASFLSISGVDLMVRRTSGAGTVLVSPLFIEQQPTNV